MLNFPSGTCETLLRAGPHDAETWVLPRSEAPMGTGRSSAEHARGPTASHGLTTGTPAAAKGAASSVATVNPWNAAMALIRPAGRLRH